MPTDAVLGAFAAALLSPDQALPPGLVTWNGSDPTARFNVYRNNVIVGLTEALADSFPVVRSLVGEAFFAAMARAFITAAPPRGPLLTDYGAGLAAFIDGFPPAAGLPYLGDMARLEWARLMAWHAPDVPALEPAALASRLAEPAGLPAARLRLHPSVTLLRSAWGVVSLWAAHQGAGPIGAVDLGRPEAALVLRAGDDAPVIPLAPATARFIAALADGAPLAAAAAGAGTGLDLPGSLALLIGQGALCSWQTPA